MKRIAFNTLGCRLNQYETDALVSEFRNAGYRIVGWHEKADAYVINTCTVTEKSDRKSRALIYQALRASETGLEAEPTSGGTGSDERPVIVVTGCFVENAVNNLANDHRISYAVDNDKKAHIFSIVDGHLHGTPVELKTVAADRFAFTDSVGGFHTRSAVKIQDGCDNFCSFCIIPAVRGRAVSRPSDEVLKQVSESLQGGAKEIVITGVNIGEYSHGGVRFSQLLRMILDLDGDFRVRVSSIEPDTASGRHEDSWESGFLELLDHPKLCPHLHLCLQSGSDRILKTMDRRYSVSSFLETVDILRSRRPDFNLTTDIMVGFPGETDKDFELTVRTCEKAGFSHIHTFPYSVRPGTPAANLEQVPSKIKTTRARIIRELGEKQKLAYRKSLIGKGQLLLVEQVKDRIARGYGEHYVPVEMKIVNGAPETGANTFITVRLTAVKPGKESVLVGVPVTNPVG